MSRHARPGCGPENALDPRPDFVEGPSGSFIIAGKEVGPPLFKVFPGVQFIIPAGAVPFLVQECKRFGGNLVEALVNWKIEAGFKAKSVIQYFCAGRDLNPSSEILFQVV